MAWQSFVPATGWSRMAASEHRLVHLIAELGGERPGALLGELGRRRHQMRHEAARLGDQRLDADEARGAGEPVVKRRGMGAGEIMARLARRGAERVERAGFGRAHGRPRAETPLQRASLAPPDAEGVAVARELARDRRTLRAPGADARPQVARAEGRVVFLDGSGACHGSVLT